jgi:hypothetical protein
MPEALGALAGIEKWSHSDTTTEGCMSIDARNGTALTARRTVAGAGARRLNVYRR